MTRRNVLWIGGGVVALLLLLGVGLSLGRMIAQKAVVGPSVTIRSPADGAQVPVGRVTSVHSTSRDEENLVKRVELWVDGELMETDVHEQGAALFSVGQGWQPLRTGTHVLTVRAVNGVGVEGRASVRVEVVEAEEVAQEAAELPGPGELPSAEEFIESRTLPPAGGVTPPPGGLPADSAAAQEGEAPVGFLRPRPWAADIDLGGLAEAAGPDLVDWLASIPVHLIGSLTPEMGAPEAVEFEALTFSVDADYDEVYCYAALVDEPVERIPLDGSLRPAGARSWDVAQELGGENRKLVRVYPPNPLRVFLECYAWSGDTLIPLGISERDHSPDEWDGRVLELISSPGGGFSVQYRITRVAGPPAPHDLELIGTGSLRYLRWEWDGNPGEIDGFRLYRDGNAVQTILPSLRVVHMPETWFQLRCGESTEFTLTAYRGAYGGEEIESLPSSPAIFAMEPCPSVSADVLGIDLVSGQACGALREIDIRYRLEAPGGFHGVIAAWLVAPDGSVFGSSTAEWLTPTGAEGEGVVRLYLEYGGGGRAGSTGILVGMWHEELDYFYAEIVDLPLVWREDRPDLVIYGASASTSALQRSVSILNAGCGRAEFDASTLRFDSLDGVMQEESEPFRISLGPGEQQTWWEHGIPWPLPFPPPPWAATVEAEQWRERWANGFQVTVDPANRLDEVHEDNNSFEWIPFVFSEGGRHVWSAQPIFGEPDTDGDGVSDIWENAATRELNPYIGLDEGEDLLLHSDHRAVGFTRVTSFPSRDNPRFILFYYVLAWSRDYGRFGDYGGPVHQAHNGDTEPVLMAWRVIDEHNLQLERVYNMAHGGSTKQANSWDPYAYSCNSAGISNADGDRVGTCQYCSALDFYDNRLLFHASEDKHALYPSCRVCEDVTLVELPVIANTLATIRDSLSLGIVGLIEAIVEAFSWLEDDRLGNQVVVFTDQELRGVPPTLAGHTEPEPYVGRVEISGRDYRYSIGWRLFNADYPHVRLVLTDVHCHDQTCDTAESDFWCGGCCPCRDCSDEPYVLVVGFSMFPEGTAAWVPEPIPPIGDDVDTGEDDEDFPEIVVFDGEVTKDYIIGFAISMFEDDGRETSQGDRRRAAERLAEEVRSRYSGQVAPGDCGEPQIHRLAEFYVDEDCNGAGIHRFPVYNIGSPASPWFDNLASFGFPGEGLAGIWCGGGECKYGACRGPCPTGTGFCGSEGCSYRCDAQCDWEFTCATPVLKFLREDAWISEDRPDFGLLDLQRR